MKTAAQVAYASETFGSLSDVVRELEEHYAQRRWRAIAATVLRRRRELIAGIRLLRRLPVVDVELSDQPAGRAIGRRLGGRRTLLPTGRIARASLRLPDDPAEYLRGRSRQAVRTNLRHAEEAGIACEPLPSLDQQEACLAEFARLGGWDRRYMTDVLEIVPGCGRFHIARDADGRPIALATVEVDVSCAYLVFLQAVDGPLSAPARYALSVHVVNDLIARGVRLLLVGNAVRLHPGLRYFQQRLGFEVCNVRIGSRLYRSAETMSVWIWAAVSAWS